MKPPSRLIAWSSPDDDGESQLVSACVYFFALKLYWARLEKSLCKGTEETVKEVQVRSITTTHNAREQQRSLASQQYGLFDWGDLLFSAQGELRGQE